MEIAGLENLRSHLFANTPLVLNTPFASMINDVLSAGHDIIDKVRDSIKYVKASEDHEAKFFDLKQQLQVPGERHLVLDDNDDQSQQGKATYRMLESALDLKEVFSLWDLKAFPTVEDWKQVETICTFLKSLFRAMHSLVVVVSSPCAPACTLFQEALRIHVHIACAATHSDMSVVGRFVKPMQEKLDKYWREYGLVLAIAVAMDPRFKMAFVEFCFRKIFGKEYSSSAYVKMVDTEIHELFDKYVALDPLPPPSPADEHNDHGGIVAQHELDDFDVYIMETTSWSQQWKSELDRYLEENLVARTSEFDVLEWWELNSVRYPRLSKMARDMLSIPVSTASPPESVQE